MSASWDCGLTWSCFGGRGAAARRRHAGFAGCGRGVVDGRGEEGEVDQPWGTGAGLRVSFVETRRECAWGGGQGAGALGLAGVPPWLPRNRRLMSTALNCFAVGAMSDPVLVFL